MGAFDPLCFRNVLVAQLAEQVPLKNEVAGSMPVEYTFVSVAFNGQCPSLLSCEVSVRIRPETHGGSSNEDTVATEMRVYTPSPMSMLVWSNW